MVYLFETEYDYLHHIVKPGYQMASNNINNPNQALDYNREARFKEFKPIDYYIKIFSAHPGSNFIEHNQNFPIQLKEPLSDFSRTTLKMKTTGLQVRSATLDKIEFFSLPPAMELEAGSSYTYRLYKIVHNSSGPDTIIVDSEDLIADQLDPLVIYPKKSQLDEFTNDWRGTYVITLSAGPDKKYSSLLDLFGLLNDKQYFSTHLVKYKSPDEIDFKLEVNWL